MTAKFQLILCSDLTANQLVALKVNLVAMQLLQPYEYHAAIRNHPFLTVYEPVELTHCVSQSIVTHYPVSKVAGPN